MSVSILSEGGDGTGVDDFRDYASPQSGIGTIESVAGQSAPVRPLPIALKAARVSKALIALLASTWAASAFAVDAESIAVTVRVRTPSGAPAMSAYVALVPEWRPSSRPLVETIAEKGVARVNVPAGRYGVIAGARDFALSSVGPISVSNTSAEVSVDLKSLKQVSGSVTDENGRPIAGAHVSGANRAIPAPFGKVSELAMRHLGADWEATADEAGRWTLKLPDGAAPLFVEAPGREPLWRILSDADPLPLTVALRAGATLTVSIDRQDPDLIVTLAREASVAEPSIPAEKQPLVWARRAEGASITWGSLPPGVYGIYAKYPEARFFTQVAARIATVSLSAGEERTERVTLPERRQAAASVAALFLADISREDLGSSLEAFGRDDKGLPKDQDVFVESVIGGTVVYIRAEGVLPPFYALTDDHVVFAMPALTESHAGASATPSQASIFPRANAYAQFRFADETLPIPPSGLARLRGCEDGTEIAVPIEIRKSGYARFTGGAGCRSLLLQVEPFEPVVIGKPLKPGDQDLGEFILRAAAAADVHVVREHDGSFVAGAEVEFAVSDGETGGSPSIIVGKGTTDGAGWVHTSGLPTYREISVSALTPEGAKSDGAVVTIEPGGRGTVDPLVVPKSAELIVDAEIEEAFRARFPAARVVAVLIQPFEWRRQAEKRQEVPTAEPIRFGPLHPGHWLVSAVVQVENTYAPVELDDLDLKSGESRRIEKAISLNVFDGLVTYEGAGIATKLKIGTTPSDALEFTSGPDGVFRAVLPQKGTYRVAVARLSAPSNHMPLGEVAFIDPSRRVEIRIPKGSTVAVRVRGGDRPIPQALVWVSSRDESGVVDSAGRYGRETDSDGEATFEDLSAGIWTFSVRMPGKAAAAEKLVSLESGESKTIELDLGETVGIRGTVRALAGTPLPRCRVECLFVGSTGNPDRASAVTDAEGKFGIEVTSPPPPVAFCGVIGPMGTVDAVKLVPGERSDIIVPAATAALRIQNWEQVVNPESWWLVSPDGRAVSVGSVARSLGQIGAPLTIPAIAAGRWRLVHADSQSQWMGLARGLGSALEAVAEASVTAGHPVTIEIDNLPSRNGGLE